MNKEENSIVFVEAKWNNKPLGGRILQSLKEKAQKVEWGKKGRKEYFALVAKGGFSDALVKQAQKENILLIQKDHLLKETVS